LDEACEGSAAAPAQAEKNLHNARELFQSVLQSTFSQKGDDWVETTLGEVCENLDSKRIPITKNKRVAGEIPYYGASGIVDHVAEHIFDEDLLLVSEDGANLLARTYPIAFSISGKTWVNNHAHVLKFEDLAAQHFMEFYLNSIKLDPYVSGMAQPKLNQKSLNSIPVPSPPLPTQQAIVEKLDALSEETKRLEAIYERKQAALTELKQSLLQKAFAGEL
jgi:type I restriction enzyme S subunit